MTQTQKKNGGEGKWRNELLIHMHAAARTNPKSMLSKRHKTQKTMYWSEHIWTHMCSRRTKLTVAESQSLAAMLPMDKGRELWGVMEISYVKTAVGYMTINLSNLLNNLLPKRVLLDISYALIKLIFKMHVKNLALNLPYRKCLPGMRRAVRGKEEERRRKEEEVIIIVQCI